MPTPRVLLIETSQYQPVSPLFGPALAELASEGALAYQFFDECRAAPRYARLSIIGRASNKVAQVLRAEFLAAAQSARPDIVLACKAAWLDRATIEQARAATGAQFVNYLTDDPANRLASPSTWAESLPYYDLCAATKEVVTEELRNAGCRAEYLPFAYNPVVHFPERAWAAAEVGRFTADVAFVGTMEPLRAELLQRVVRRLPSHTFALYGNGWNRHRQLRRLYRGPATGRTYRLATAHARVNVNVLRTANRDDMVMRSFEIPAMGGFMLAERSATQATIFPEDVAAAFFEGEDELVDRIERYLADETHRQAVAAEGHRVVTEGRHTYRTRFERILELIGR